MHFLPYLFGILGFVLFAAVAQMAGQKSGGIIGVIRGEDGRLSSSKFQFFLWTGVVIFSWVAIHFALIGKTCTGSTEFPSNVLLAMGFSVITLATAKGVTTAYVYSGRMAKGTGNAWSLSDLVRADDSTAPDLSKVQMLTWTFIAAISYVYVTVAQVNSQSLSCSIPNIDTALMVLMGIGQGAYLGTKIVTQTTIVLRSLSKPQTFAGDTITINGSGFGTTPGSVYFGAVAASLAPGQAWTDTAIQTIVPSIDSTDNKPFIPGDTVSVGLLLTGSDGTNSTGNTLPFTYAAAPAPSPPSSSSSSGSPGSSSSSLSASSSSDSSLSS